MSPSRDRRTLAAFLTDFINYGVAMSAVSMVTYLPLYLKTNGASDLVIGLVPAAFAAGRMSGVLAAPRLEAKPLVRRWMVAVMLLERLPLALCGLWILLGPAERPGLMVAGILCLWVTYTIINGWATTSWGTFVSRSLTRPERGTLSGVGFTLSSLTGLAVVPLVGWAITRFGLAHGYGGAFLVAGLLLMASCLVFLRVREEPYAHVKQRVSLAGYLKQMLPVLRADGRFRWFLAVMALWLMGSTGAAYFTVFAMARFGADASTVMAYTLAMSLGAGLAGLVGARVAGHVGYVRVFLAGIGLTAAAMLAAYLATGSTGLYLAFALTGASGAASWMAIINLPLELADPPNVPTYYAVASLVRGPAGALAPIAAGLYLGHFPYQPLFLFCALLSLVAALLLWRYVHEPAPCSR
ncbi:MAG: MFS transporter [Gemmatimonadetes bacterium]|jgi:MFS family permease|nr:MFS transporter [Gemmatimonadota bacterium]MBT7858768.1 MFS transporter [Gemmatimonadota bacterium]